MDEKSTEDKIFDAARDVFHERGFNGARMQEIADRAGINKSMLHYYYRSKDKLFEAVFRASAMRLIPQLFEIIQSELPLREKIERFVHSYVDLIRANPQVPAFIIYELNRQPDWLRRFVGRPGRVIFEKLSGDVRRAVEAGEIRPIAPEHLIANMIALCVFPFLARPMLETAMALDGASYDAFLEERKRVVTAFLFDALRP